MTNKTQPPDHIEFRVNGATFIPPDVPILLQILSGKSKASDLLPSGSIYGLEAGKVVEISIPAGAGGGPVSRANCESHPLGH